MDLLCDRMSGEGTERSRIDLEAEVEFVQGGIVSKTLLETEEMELDLFCLSSGQGLSEHSASTDAVVHVLRGRGRVSIEEMEYSAEPGSIFFINANAKHAIHSVEDLVFLLTLPLSASP